MRDSSFLLEMAMGFGRAAIAMEIENKKADTVMERGSITAASLFRFGKWVPHHFSPIRSFLLRCLGALGTVRSNDLFKCKLLLSVYRRPGARVVCNEADRASAPAHQPRRTFSFFTPSFFLSNDHDAPPPPPKFMLLLLSVLPGSVPRSMN